MCAQTVLLFLRWIGLLRLWSEARSSFVYGFIYHLSPFESCELSCVDRRRRHSHAHIEFKVQTRVSFLYSSLQQQTD